ncbi:MAG: cation diffusion facilitator family transporter [Bacteroidota bacterium]|jgi:cation diffusion facilitator family transporter
MSKEKSNDHGTGHIIQSLIVNVLIACSKGFAAFMTGSGSMLAETIHSFADCANQGLLLVGVKQAKRPATKKHPLGYGRAVYFWSFMVAMLLFSIGGMFSIYEGLHKFSHPEPVEHIEWGVGILLFSLALEGYSTFSNIVELNKRRGSVGFFRYLRSTKDSDLIVIFGENSAAVFGLILAIIALLTSFYTGDGRYDALGSLAIGVVLIAVAIFLSVEVKSLLIGESADAVINDLVEKEAEKSPEILELINCITIQQGPGEVLMCVKIKCKHDLSALQISTMINKFESDIRNKAPEVKWIYIEPDLQEWK